MNQPRGEGKSQVDLRALSDEDLPSEEEEGRSPNPNAAKRPLSRQQGSGLRKGTSPANSAHKKKDKKEPATKKRKVEQTPSPYRPPSQPFARSSSPSPYRPGTSSPTSSPFSSVSLPPSKLLLALSSLPNAKRLSKLIGADGDASFDEWPNRLTSPANSNIPSHKQRKYVMHFVSLWESILSDEEEVSRTSFSQDLQVIIKSHYPCDQRTILDQVLATFLLFHPEHVSGVLSALIDLLSPPAPAAPAFAPNSPFEISSIKSKKRVLSYNRKNIPFSNLLGLFTACREEEGGFYYRPTDGDEREESTTQQASTTRNGTYLSSPHGIGWSPSLLACSEIIRVLIERCYPPEGQMHEDLLHPSRKICAWLTDCLIESPPILREEHFNSLLSQIDKRGTSGAKKGPVVLLKELVFQELAKYRTLTLAQSLLPLLLSRHQHFMRSKKSFSLSLSLLQESTAAASFADSSTSGPHPSPSVVGFLLPFRAVFKSYFSQPAQVQSQQFVYQLLRAPPLQSSGSTLEDSHVIFPLFELLVTIFSRNATLKKNSKKKQKEKQTEEDTLNIHAWFANHFLDPILEILGGEDGVGVPQAKRLLEKVFFNRTYSSLLFGQDDIDLLLMNQEASDALDQGQPTIKVESEKGKEKETADASSSKNSLRRKSGDDSVDGAAGKGTEAEEREKLRLRMMLTLLDVMRNYGKEVQKILMDIWEQSWTNRMPSALTPAILGTSAASSSVSSMPTTALLKKGEGLLSFRSPPTLDFSSLSAKTSSSVVGSSSSLGGLSWERLKALLSLYRTLSPEFQAMSRRIFISFLHQTARQRKDAAKDMEALQVYQKILHFFISEGKRGFASLFIDFLEFISAEEGENIANRLQSHFSRLFGILTLDAVAVRTFDHCQSSSSSSGHPLSSLGVFSTAYRAEILSSLMKAKPSSSAFAHLKSPFKSKRPGGSGGGKTGLHPHSYLEACGDEPSKTRAAALLLLDTLKELSETSKAKQDDKTDLQAIKAEMKTEEEGNEKEKREKESEMMVVEEEVVEEVDMGSVGGVMVERDFVAKAVKSEEGDKTKAADTSTGAETVEGKNKREVVKYLRRVLLSKSFVDYLFKGLAPSTDADSRAMVTQLLLQFVKMGSEGKAKTEEKGKEKEKESSAMEIDTTVKEEKESEHTQEKKEDLYLAEVWRDKRNVKVLLSLLADPYPQTAEQAEEYIRILLKEAKENHNTTTTTLPHFVGVMMEGLWERVSECADYEGEGRRLVSILGSIAFNWPQLRKGMVKKVDELLLLKGGKEDLLAPRVKEHCWPNPCLLVLLRALNTNEGRTRKESEQENRNEREMGQEIVDEKLMAKAMLGILRNDKDVQMKQYELLASCIERDDEGGGRQMEFFASQLPVVVQGLCSPFTDVRQLCFLILKKALEVKKSGTKNEKGEENKNEKEKEKEKERDWNGEVLIARIEDEDVKRESALGEYIAQLFDERLKMELVRSNDPTTLHVLQDAQQRLRL